MAISVVNKSLDAGLRATNAHWFTEKDGILSRQSNGRSTPSAWFDEASNQLWVATAKGLTKANLNKRLVSAEKPPPPNFEAIFVSENQINISGKVEINPEDTSLRLDFASLDLVLGENIFYRARLSDISNDWTTRERLNFIEYFNFSPGNYTFEVQASYDKQNWSESSKLIIVKKPFWWQTDLASFLLIWILIAIIFAIFWYRALNAKRIQVKLEKQVRERTSELEKKSEQLIRINKEKSKLVNELHEKSSVLKELSTKDPLTNLLNRRAFEVECKTELLRAQRNNNCFLYLFH